MEDSLNRSNFYITIDDHIRLIKRQIIYLVIYAVFAILCCINTYLKEGIYLIASTIFFLIFIAPSIYLHITYYFESKNIKIIEFEHAIEIYRNDKLKIKLTKENIQSIELYMSSTFIDYDYPQGGIPWEEYNYALIRTKESFYIFNNLIYPDIKHISSVFPSADIKFNKTIFAFLP